MFGGGFGMHGRGGLLGNRDPATEYKPKNGLKIILMQDWTKSSIKKLFIFSTGFDSRNFRNNNFNHGGQPP